jgi:hypothetical protein
MAGEMLARCIVAAMSLGLRLATAVVALVVCAWFALGIRESHEIASATGVVAGSGQPSAHELAAAEGALSNADLLNPDQEVDILRARVDIKRGDNGAARALLATVTRREPQNLEAWIWFTGASLGDHAAAAIGAARIAQLDPLDAKVVGR